jgi:hypothetical protein
MVISTEHPIKVLIADAPPTIGAGRTTPEPALIVMKGRGDSVRWGGAVQLWVHVRISRRLQSVIRSIRASVDKHNSLLA